MVENTTSIKSYYSQMVVTGKNIYALGGEKNLDSEFSEDNIFRASITKDKLNYSYNIEYWERCEETLPDHLSELATLAIKNRIYILGGYGQGGYSSRIYFAKINKYGYIGEWNYHYPLLPENIYESTVFCINNKLYIIFGKKVYVTNIKQNGDLGKWEKLHPLPESISNAQVIPIGNRLYLFGGMNEQGYIDRFYYSEISQNGELGQWLVDETIDREIGIRQIIMLNDKDYLTLNFNFIRKRRYVKSHDCSDCDFHFYAYYYKPNRKLIDSSNPLDEHEIKHISISGSSLNIVTDSKVFLINTKNKVIKSANNEIIDHSPYFKLITSYTSKRINLTVINDNHEDCDDY